MAAPTRLLMYYVLSISVINLRGFPINYCALKHQDMIQMQYDYSVATGIIYN